MVRPGHEHHPPRAGDRPRFTQRVAAGENPRWSSAAAGEDVDVRSFECLGACDIAPMASVNGEYVGPLTPKDAEAIIDDLRAGRPVLADKQIRYRRSMDTDAAHPAGSSDETAREFSEPDHPHRADTAGLTDADQATDRPGPSAPIEIPPPDPEPT